MTELYKLFEKDSLSDLLALTNIAKRISGNKEILINFNQNSRIAFTDGSFIYLPRNTKDDIKSAFPSECPFLKALKTSLSFEY